MRILGQIINPHKFAVREYSECVFPVFLHSKNYPTQKNPHPTVSASIVTIIISIAIRLLKQTCFPIIQQVQCTCFLHNLTKGSILYKHSLTLCLHYRQNAFNWDKIFVEYEWKMGGRNHSRRMLSWKTL